MRKRTWQGLRLAGLMAAFALLLYIFRDTDPRNIWLSLIGLDPLYLLPVVIGMIGMPLVRAVRLKYIMAPRRELPVRRVFAVYNVGQLLNIMLPVLTGQVGRIILFSRTLQITKTFAFTVVMLEVLFDGVVLLMTIFAASFLIVMPDWMVRGEVVVLVACLFLLGFFYLVLHRHRNAPEKEGSAGTWLPTRLAREWDNARTSFLAGLDMLTSRRHLFLTVVLSVLSWVVHALIVLCLLRAFEFEIPFWGAIIILIVNTLAIMVPVSPGNVGTFQLACIVGLGFFGIAKDEALAFSLILHAVELAPVFALGAIASFSAHVRLKEYTGAEVLAEQERLSAGSDDSAPEAGNSSECSAERETVPVDPAVTQREGLQPERREP